MRLLILAPHPDDEILGTTALITHWQAQGHGQDIRVVVVSDGAAGGSPSQRREESLAGLSQLGLPPEQIEFWDAPDGALPLNASQRQRYRQLIADWSPDTLALPAPSEAHPDHRRLTRGVLDALTGHWQGELLFFETTTPLPQVNSLLPLDLDRKLAALACHASQLPQYDYPGLVRGLAALRGAAHGSSAAEGYLAFDWDGSPQNFFEQRPLVSIILRADDLGFLRHALASLAEQSYDQLEAIVIWHGNDDPAPSAIDTLAPTLELRWQRGPGPRAANLNAGLAIARGLYLGFLDQDDILYPDHLATLVAELQADPDLDLAYGNCQRSECERRADGSIHRRQWLDQLGQPWRPARLLAGNHIPLHSFLCRRRLAQQLGFCTELDAYEDWDFLARAELAGARFRHSNETVCEYRLYPARPLPPYSSTNAPANPFEQEHRAKGYTDWGPAVEARHLPLLQSADYSSLLQLLRQLEGERDQARHEAAQLRQEASSRQSRLDALQESQDDLNRWADLLAPTPLAGSPAARLAAQALTDGPRFSLLLPVCDPAPEFFDDLLHSLLAQSYPHWQLCLADDASTSPAILDRLNALSQRAGSDPRLRLLRRPERGGIGAATASAATLADGDWLLFIDHDDRLAPDTLLHLALASRQHPTATALYTDSRMIDRTGAVLHHYRKSGWAPESLLHINYINHLSAFRRDLYTAIGGIALHVDGSQDWELWLRASRHPDFAVHHLPLPLYDWRAHEGSVAYSLSAKPHVLQAACTATREHLHATLPALAACSASSQPASDGPGVTHHWPAEATPGQALTAIVPTHHNPDDLARLIDSLAGSDYPGLQVILIANRVADATTRELLAAASQRPGWQVLEDGRPFNWAALNNAAVAHSHTPWLLFLNDDISWRDPQALRQLSRYLHLSPAIGAVGARLHYGPEQGGALQHDGIITEPELIAHALDHKNQQDYLTGAPRNVSAVTGACLLTTRAAFDRCGGFDERLAVAYNDVDYCLHLRRLGYRIVQASDVVLTHRESRTLRQTPALRQSLAEESSLMRAKWGDFLTETLALQYRHYRHRTRILSIPETAA